uniref:Transcription regulatory protein OpdE n=1 Tax=Ralstonia solanacearum TaxID=305 RepID=A0A0S4TU48_RALSL
MLAVGIDFMGQLTLFTYVRPFLETVTRVDATTLSLTLLVIGIAGFIGTTLVGTVLKRGLYQTLISIPILMAIIAGALVLFGSKIAVVAALLGVWGLVAWWNWIARTFPKNAEAGGGLMVAIVQLAIALGSTVGGLLLDKSGYQSTFMASAMLPARG